MTDPMKVAILLALIEAPELGDDIEAMRRRVLELLELSEGMRESARKRPPYRLH